MVLYGTVPFVAIEFKFEPWQEKKVCDRAKKHIDTPETKTRLGELTPPISRFTRLEELGGSSRLKKLNNNPD